MKKQKKGEIKFEGTIRFITAIVLILILVSIGIYNYKELVDYNAYEKFFEVIKAVIEGLINTLNDALCAIGLCSSSFWSTLIVIAIFVGIAWYISKDESGSEEKKSDNGNGKENGGND
jgi:uncharacterized membrane protein